MSPAAEVRLTGKLTTIIVVVSLIVNMTAAYTTVKLYTAAMMAAIADHETRLRTVETCISSDLSAIKSDQAWIMNTLDRQERLLEDIQGTLRDSR